MWRVYSVQSEEIPGGIYEALRKFKSDHTLRLNQTKERLGALELADNRFLRRFQSLGNEFRAVLTFLIFP